MWYSAGRDGGVKKNGKWYFKAGKTKAKVRAARYDGKIATVIRIRNLKAATVKKPKKAKGKSKSVSAVKADEKLKPSDETSEVEFEEIIPEYEAEEEVSEPEDGGPAEPPDPSDTTEANPDASESKPEDTAENVISGGETSDEPRDFETEENDPEDEDGATVDDSANDTILDLDKNEVISVKDGTRKKIQDGYEESRDPDNPDTKRRDTNNPDTESRDTKEETNKVRRIDTPETGDDGFAVAMVLLILSCSGLLVMAHRRNPES